MTITNIKSQGCPDTSGLVVLGFGCGSDTHTDKNQPEDKNDRLSSVVTECIDSLNDKVLTKFEKYLVFRIHKTSLHLNVGTKEFICTFLFFLNR